MYNMYVNYNQVHAFQEGGRAGHRESNKNCLQISIASSQLTDEFMTNYLAEYVDE